MTKDIFVYIEVQDNNLLDVSLELINKAKELNESRKDFGFQVVGVLIGNKIKDLAKEVIYYGADKVIYCDHVDLEIYNTMNYAEIIKGIIEEYKPEIFLYGGTILGRDLAPRISAKVNTGLTADATSIEFDPNDVNSKELWITRPAFGGNLFATIVCPNHKPQMATVRSNVFEKASRNTSKTGETLEYKYNILTNNAITLVRKIDKVQKKSDITKAKIIVSGGRGMSTNIDLLEETAQNLKGEVGASRALIDEGLCPKTIQVGQTGKTVKPIIYLACGISGAVQHTAGMENSEMIIAINTDENAPIFDVADISIIGDASKILHELNTRFK